VKVISWNVLRLTGAAAEDVAALVERHRPDLVLLQEAMQELSELPKLVGGTLFREPMERRIYGLAMWSPHALPRPRTFRLPASQVPGRVPPRIAQIVNFAGISFANVHLSHGQFLNRWQLFRIASALNGPSAIIGDYNAVGPIGLPGFRDVGPRQRTHSLSFRLDRCMARDLGCAHPKVLARGPSDHHPILLELQIVPAHADAPEIAWERRRLLRGNFERLLAAVQEKPLRARMRRSWMAHGHEEETRRSA
jgi:endonuclease/exonuclease/phosphatase family metal-dependent hydrolase